MGQETLLRESRVKGRRKGEWECWKQHRKKEKKGLRMFKQHPKEARGEKNEGKKRETRQNSD